MPRNDPNTLYWDSIDRSSIRDAYNKFLQQEIHITLIFLQCVTYVNIKMQQV